MLGALIRNGSATLVADLPSSTIDLLIKLVSIGITQTPDHINLSDEEDPIRVKLYTTEPEEAHLLSLLTPDMTLADANISMLFLQKANLNEQPQLKSGLLEDKYKSLDDFFNGAKLLFADEAAKEVKAIALRKFDKRVPPFCKTLRKLTAKPVCLLRRYLARREGLPKMICNHIVLASYPSGLLLADLLLK